MTSVEALIMGISLGLSAGIIPGPLLGLVIAETLRGGWQAGALVSLAPLIADGPIIILSFLLLVWLPSAALSLLGIMGGLYVVFLGWEALHSSPASASPGERTTAHSLGSLSKGVTVNFLNPHPYLFWLTVGGSLIAESYHNGAILPMGSFLIAFYGCLVGSKVAIALLTHWGKATLKGRSYLFALQASGVLLMALGLYLFGEGTKEMFFTF